MIWAGPAVPSIAPRRLHSHPPGSVISAAIPYTPPPIRTPPLVVRYGACSGLIRGRRIDPLLRAGSWHDTARAAGSSARGERDREGRLGVSRTKPGGRLGLTELADLYPSLLRHARHLLAVKGEFIMRLPGKSISNAENLTSHSPRAKDDLRRNDLTNGTGETRRLAWPAAQSAARKSRSDHSLGPGSRAAPAASCWPRPGPPPASPSARIALR